MESGAIRGFFIGIPVLRVRCVGPLGCQGRVPAECLNNTVFHCCFVSGCFPDQSSGAKAQADIISGGSNPHHMNPGGSQLLTESFTKLAMETGTTCCSGVLGLLWMGARRKLHGQIAF